MLKKLGHITILFFITLSIGAQEDNEHFDPAIGADTSFIKSYQDIFTPRFVIISKRNQFSIVDQKPDSTGSPKNTSLDFQPNDPLNIGLGFTYKWLGINMAFNLPFINNDDDIYGKTRRFDLSTHIYGRKLIVDLAFQWYKGYYLSNPENIVPGWEPGDPYPSREDIKVFTFGASGWYVFNNERFSYRSAFTFNERQLKSAGSPVLGGGISWYFVDADSSLVSDVYINEFDSISIERAQIGNTYVIGGYAYNFVVKNFYLSMTLGLGFGLSNDKLYLNQETIRVQEAGIGVVSVFRASVGYNSDKFYVGLSMYNNAFSISTRDDIGLLYSYTGVNVYVGYRFEKVFKKKEPLPWLWNLKI